MIERTFIVGLLLGPLLGCSRDLPQQRSGTPGDPTRELVPSWSELGPIPQLPGLPPPAQQPYHASESNGGSGAGAVGTKGDGESLHNGTNGELSPERPDMFQKTISGGPGDLKPGE